MKKITLSYRYTEAEYGDYLAKARHESYGAHTEQTNDDVSNLHLLGLATQWMMAK